MDPGDGLVWFGETVHFAYGGDRRVLSMSLIDGEHSVFDGKTKPHLNWDWYDHGLEEGDLIQGPYFPQHALPGGTYQTVGQWYRYIQVTRWRGTQG